MRGNERCSSQQTFRVSSNQWHRRDTRDRKTFYQGSYARNLCYIRKTSDGVIGYNSDGLPSNPMSRAAGCASKAKRQRCASGRCFDDFGIAALGGRLCRSPDRNIEHRRPSGSYESMSRELELMRADGASAMYSTFSMPARRNSPAATAARYSSSAEQSNTAMPGNIPAARLFLTMATRPSAPQFPSELNDPLDLHRSHYQARQNLAPKLSCYACIFASRSGSIGPRSTL
jgi:hypothetical protein